MGGGDSETTTEPWEGYQPYLTGRGDLPEWLMNGRPGPASEEWAQMNDYRGAGANAGMMGMTPGDIRDPMGVAPSEWDSLLYGSWNMSQPEMYAGAGQYGIGPNTPGMPTSGPGSSGGGDGDGGGNPFGDGAFYSPGIGSLLAGSMEGLFQNGDTGGGGGLIQLTDGSYWSPQGPVDGLFGDLSTSEAGNWGGSS